MIFHLCLTFACYFTRRFWRWVPDPVVDSHWVCPLGAAVSMRNDLFCAYSALSYWEVACPFTSTVVPSGASGHQHAQGEYEVHSAAAHCLLGYASVARAQGVSGRFGGWQLVMLAQRLESAAQQGILLTHELVFACIALHHEDV